MLRRDSGKSISFCDGFRRRCSLHVGGVFLSLLAVMLFATPHLAFGQGSVAVTATPNELNITEGQGASVDDTYTVVLDVAPSNDVTITVEGSTLVTLADGTTQEGVDANPKTLTFTAPDPADPVGSPGSWNTAQTVTVTVHEDRNGAGETVKLTHKAMVGDDEVAVRGASVVTVKVTDSDPRGVSLVQNGSPVTPLTVPEAGNVSYTVELDTQPTGTVMVDVGGAKGELTVGPSRLFFTPDNYDTAQTVSVYAGVDFDADPDEATLTHVARGADYTPVSVNSLEVMVTDPDVRGVTVSTGSLNIPAGRSDTYTVRLNTQPKPSRSVFITVTEATDSAGVSVNRPRLTFTASNWNQEQTVTVRATSTATATDNVTLNHAVEMVEATSNSRDTDYDGATIQNQDVQVAIVDSPTALTLSRSSVPINEGQSTTYTVRMSPAPSSSTNVTVASNNSDVTVNGAASATVTIEPANDPVTVTVASLEDEDGVRDTAIITHTVSGETAVSRELPVSVTDNDTRGVTLSQTSLEVLEGASETYTVILETMPTDTVTVAITGAEGDVTVTPLATDVRS